MLQMNPQSNESHPLSLGQRFFMKCWRNIWFRKQFYNAIGLFLKRRVSWQFMNCGYCPDKTTKLTHTDEKEYFSLELYASLVRGTSIEGLDLLELGCGRGGGARFLHSQFHPRRLVALDTASSMVHWSQKHFGSSTLEFIYGDAANPYFFGKLFDVIICVEVLHNIKDKSAFLSHVTRLLNSKGRLLIADFFYTRSDAMHALSKFESALKDSSFKIIAIDDWTDNVKMAIEKDSERRLTDIQANVPRFFRHIATGFASTTTSSTYKALCGGKAVYRRYVLEKQF